MGVAALAKNKRFTQMQGCGNDYVYVDCFRRSGRHAKLAIAIADRHGVGGDGLISSALRNAAMQDAHVQRRQNRSRDVQQRLRHGQYAYDHGIAKGTWRSGRRSSRLISKYRAERSGPVDWASQYQPRIGFLAGNPPISRQLHTRAGNAHVARFMGSRGNLC